MKIIPSIIGSLLLAALTLTHFGVSALAQKVSIPDRNLNAVIRGALQKPNGPLTAQGLLGLPNNSLPESVLLPAGIKSGATQSGIRTS
jgi:hypothetical protein